MGFFGKAFDKIKAGLAKTKKVLTTPIQDLFVLTRKLDEKFIDELEETTLVPRRYIVDYLAQLPWTQKPALTIDILRQRVVDDYNDPDPVADDDRAYRWQVANDLQYLNR